MPRVRLFRLIMTASIFIVATIFAAPAEARPLALEDYYRLVTLQAPAMSPDGRSVAFIRTTMVEAENRRQTELWIAATDGNSTPRRLSDQASNVSAPRWSPDGKLLAYSARR